MNVGLIGAGTIGKEVYKQVQARGHNVRFVSNTRGAYKDISLQERCDERLANEPIDVAFLQIPTLNDGSVARKMINGFLERDIPVVTCEKGAVANYFSELAPHLNRIGYTATVGGGSKILWHARNYPLEEVSEMHVILNGTLNYLLSGLSRIKSIDTLVQEAIEQNYVEPGSTDPLNIFNQEYTSDVPMKIAIFCQAISLHDACLSPHSLKVPKLNMSDLVDLISFVKIKHYRQVVSITCNEKPPEEAISWFSYPYGSWHISGGFREITKPLEKSCLLAPRASNALLILNKDGQFYSVVGEGAGAQPTVSVMMDDAERLYQQRNGKH